MKKISIYNHSSGSEYRQVYSSLDFFSESFVVSFFNEYGIGFRRPDIDDNKRLTSTKRKDKKAYSFSIKCYLPTGVLFLDEEESNEDELFFYYD